MLEVIEGLPDGVIGFEGKGELQASDYTQILLPAIEAAAKNGKIRVVLVFETWDGMSFGALGQDLKLGVEHLTKWKKIALVTEVEWMRKLTDVFGWMTPGDLKVFSLDERDAAIAWAAAD